MWDVMLSHIPEALNPMQHHCENIMSLGRPCSVITVVASSVNM